MNDYELRSESNPEVAHQAPSGENKHSLYVAQQENPLNLEVVDKEVVKMDDTNTITKPSPRGKTSPNRRTSPKSVSRRTQNNGGGNGSKSPQSPTGRGRGRPRKNSNNQQKVDNDKDAANAPEMVTVITDRNIDIGDGKIAAMEPHLDAQGNEVDISTVPRTAKVNSPFYDPSLYEFQGQQ